MVEVLVRKVGKEVCKKGIKGDMLRDDISERLTHLTSINKGDGSL